MPLDFAVDFRDLPALAGALLAAVPGNTVAYRFDGTIDIDAGLLGRRSVGPTTWITGRVPIVR